MHIWISMAIAKTASRNVAFKVARMREAMMQDQDEFITRNASFEDVVSEANDRAILEDVMLTCISPIKKTILKFRRLTSTALSSASNFRGSKTLMHFLASSSVIILFIFITYNIKRNKA